VSRNYRSLLDVMATAAMLAASVAILCVILWPRSAASPAAGQEARTYSVGESFPAIDGLDLNRRPQTLIVFLRNGCRYCDASVLFYQRLLEAHGKTELVAMSFDSPLRLRTYLAAKQLAFNKSLSVTPTIVKVTATPTLLLVSNRSIVTGVWIGQLTPAAETDVLGKL
jgi:hypothetical protein